MNTNYSIPQDEGRNMSAIEIISQNKKTLMPENPNKDVQYRLGMFIAWLDQRGQKWFEADLAAYRDYLLKPHHISVKRGDKRGDMQAVPAKSPATVAAHLASIRGRYNALLISNSVRQDFWDMAPAHLEGADRKAFVDEVLVRLQNAVHPTTAEVKQTKQQDEADSDHLRLKPHQATALLNAPDVNTFTGIRDAAIIALSLCTGLREAELTALDVDDLRQTYDGEPALRIRHGKGDKQRMVVYGPMDWCLIYVDKWLSIAGIADEAASHAARIAALPENQRKALGMIEKQDCTSRMLMDAFKWSESNTADVLKALTQARLIDQDKDEYRKKAYPVFRGFYRGGKSVRPDRLTTRSINEIMNGYHIMIDGTLRAVKPHDMRRSYARMCYDAGMDMLRIQQNLGHASLETTQIYIGALGGEQRRPPAIFNPPHSLASIKSSLIAT